MIKKGFLICMVALAFSLAEGQDRSSIEQTLPELSLPKVFLIGEYEEEYANLYKTYHGILLSVCEDDMNLAFDKWMDMLDSMESYANEIGFSLNGVKVLLNVFWNEDGSIQYISYYLKPNSLNVDTAELSAFFSSFASRYRLPLVTDRKFTHNGTAQFPTKLIPRKSNKQGMEGTTKY